MPIQDLKQLFASDFNNSKLPNSTILNLLVQAILVSVGDMAENNSTNILQDIRDNLINPNFSGTAIGDLDAGSVVVYSALGLSKAVSNNPALATVVGLVVADINENMAGAVRYSGALDLADWTAIVGVRYLTTGTYYYLDTTPGKLTSIEPSTPGLYLVRVGLALSPTNFLINIQPSILL